MRKPVPSRPLGEIPEIALVKRILSGIEGRTPRETVELRLQWMRKNLPGTIREMGLDGHDIGEFWA